VASVQEPGDHAGGQFRLGRERCVPIESDFPAAVGLVGPRAWDVDLSVHRSASAPPWRRPDRRYLMSFSILPAVPAPISAPTLIISV